MSVGTEHTCQQRIGELAARLALNPKTIRFYEDVGLLPVPRRMPNGYRFYDAKDEARLRFIVKAKAIGLTLSEIGDILAAQDDGQRPCEHVLALLDGKLAEVDRRLRALAEFRHELAALREEADETRSAEASVCGIIECHTITRSAGSAGGEEVSADDDNAR